MSAPTTDSSESMDYHAHLLHSLSTINTHNPPVHTCSTGWSFKALTSGPTSIAYLFYKLSTIYPETFEFKGQGLREWAESYVMLGGRVACGVDWNLKRSGDGLGREGIGVGCDEGVTWLVVRGVILGDEAVVAEVCKVGRTGLDGLGRCTDGVTARNDDAGGKLDGGMKIEDLGWWAGYLYLLRVLMQEFLATRSMKMIREIIERVVKAIIALDQVKRGFVSVENLNLMVGVLVQVVLSRDREGMEGVEKLMDSILKLQDQRTGSWGASTAFIVNSLESIRACLPPGDELRERIISANERARAFFPQPASSQVLPTMQPDGLITRALAFTDPDDRRFHDASSELTSEHLDKTRPGWKKEAGIKDEWVGLRTGEAGRAWLRAVGELTSQNDRDGRIDRRILGYNDV